MQMGLTFFAEGKRSRVYVFTRRGKRFALKQEKKGTAKGRIKNEVAFLKVLNKHHIGPKLVRSGKDFFVYEFVDGEKILQYMQSAKNPWPVLRKVLQQCFVLDQLGMNKLEMHHPIKHILITKKGPVMIDFERCYYTKKPKNVTQFMQFLLVLGVVRQNPAMLAALRMYKTDPSEKTFRVLVRVARAL